MDKVEDQSINHFLLAFDSTHHALVAHRVLASFGSRIIPTPRGITTGCGMSLKFKAENEQRARTIVSDIDDLKGACSLYRQTSDSAEYQLLDHF